MSWLWYTLLDRQRAAVLHVPSGLQQFVKSATTKTYQTKNGERGQARHTALLTPPAKPENSDCMCSSDSSEEEAFGLPSKRLKGENQTVKTRQYAEMKLMYLLAPMSAMSPRCAADGPPTAETIGSWAAQIHSSGNNAQI
jgi:hypothetical protein